MRSHKKTLIVAVASMTLAALAGCSSSSSSAPDASGSGGSDSGPVQIAFFNPVATNTYTKAQFDGVTSTADKSNAEVTQFDAKFDATTQVNQVQDATATGRYKLFVISPVNGAALVQAAQQAVDAGITVVAILSSIGPDIDSLQSSVPGVITVGLQPSLNGKYIAEQMIAACADKNPCKVGYMPGDAKAANENVRLAEVKKTLATAPNVQLVAEQVGGFDANTGLATAKTILTAHPDLDVLGSSAGQSMGGALQAIKEFGLDGKIMTVSNGCTTEDVTFIRDGDMFASPVTLPFTEGSVGTELGLKAMNGEKVETAISVVDYSPIGPVCDEKSLSTPEGQKFKGEYSASS